MRSIRCHKKNAAFVENYGSRFQVTTRLEMMFDYSHINLMAASPITKPPPAYWKKIISPKINIFY